MRLYHRDQIGIRRCWFLLRKTGEPGETIPPPPAPRFDPEQTARIKLTARAFIQHMTLSHFGTKAVLL